MANYAKYLQNITKYGGAFALLKVVTNRALGKVILEKDLVLLDGSTTKNIGNRFFEALEFKVKNEGNGISLWERNGKRIHASNAQIVGLMTDYFENEIEKDYKCDCNGKRILDIGGFVGDSALLFLAKGASEVVIYEPVGQNIDAMYMNLEGKKDKVKIIRSMISSDTGTGNITSSQEEGSSGFGGGKGKFQISCPSIGISDAIDAHRPDILKMDCEGCEKCLLGLDEHILSKVPYWMVEIHTDELVREIPKKFESSGFEKAFEYNGTYHFRKVLK